MRLRGGRIEVVIDEPAGGRQRPVRSGRNLFGDAVEQICGDDVSGKGIADVTRTGRRQTSGRIDHAGCDRPRRERIVDRSRENRTPERVYLTRWRTEESREVAASFSLGRHGADIRGWSRLTQSFVIAEEKCLVLANRPADRTAKLIAVKIRLGSIVEEIARVRGAIAIELVGVSVERVGTRLGDNVDDVPAAEAVLRSESVCLNLEFLDVIDGGNIDDAAPVQTRIPRAIQQIHRRIKECSTEIQERNILVGAAGNAGCADDLLFGGVAHRRAERSQTDYIAQI